MKKFAFSLERMRSYKDRLLDEEKNKLMRLRAILNEIEQKIASYEQSFSEISAELAAAEAKGTTVFEVQGFQFRLQNIRTQLEELREQREVAEGKVERQMKAVVAASQEVSKLDKLQDKQFELYQQDVKKAEDLFMEEMVVSDLLRKGAG